MVLDAVAMLAQNRKLQQHIELKTWEVERELQHVRCLLSTALLVAAAEDQDARAVATERRRAGKWMRESVDKARMRHPAASLDQGSSGSEDEDDREVVDVEGCGTSGPTSSVGVVQEIYLNGYRWRQLRPRAHHLAGAKSTVRRVYSLDGGTGGVSSSFEDPFGCAFLAIAPLSTMKDDKGQAVSEVEPQRRFWRNYGSPLSKDALALFTAQLSFPSPYNDRNMKWSARDDSLLCAAVAKAAESKVEAAGRGIKYHLKAPEEGPGEEGSLLHDVHLSESDWLRIALLLRHCRKVKAAPPESILAASVAKAADGGAATPAGWSDVCVSLDDMLRFTNYELGSFSPRCCEVRWHCVLLPLLLSTGKAFVRGVAPPAAEKLFSSDDEDWNVTSDQYLLEGLKEAKWRIDRDLWISLAKGLSQKDQRLRVPFSVVARFQRFLTPLHFRRTSELPSRAWCTLDVVRSVAESYPSATAAIVATFGRGSAHWEKRDAQRLIWIANNCGIDYDQVFREFTDYLVRTAADDDGGKGNRNKGPGTTPFFSAHQRFYSRLQVWRKLRQTRGTQLASGSEAFHELLAAEREDAPCISTRQGAVAVIGSSGGRGSDVLFGVPQTARQRLSCASIANSKGVAQPDDELSDAASISTVPSAPPEADEKQAVAGSARLTLCDLIYVGLWMRLEVLSKKSLFHDIASVFLSIHRPQMASGDVLRDRLKALDRHPGLVHALLTATDSGSDFYPSSSSQMAE